MSIGKTSFQKTNYLLDLVSQRQQVLSKNLANVDTPGYVRSDINFSQLISSSDETALASKMGSSAFQYQQDGSRVNIVSELMEMQKNSMMFSVAARRMSSVISELKTAANTGR